MRLFLPAGAALVAAVLSWPSLSAQAPGAATPAVPAPPRLVVVVAVDQMRADYVSMYGAHWKAGLHEIFNNGAYFVDAAYPYGGTKTCAGHSSIGTGTVPATHGMIDNEWYDVETRAFVTCTEDATAQSMRFPIGSGNEHHSGARLLVPTLAEQVAEQRHGRVVSVAGKARSAIGLGGHGGPNAVIVWQEDSGSWATSSRLARVRSPEIVRFVRARPAFSLGDQTWGRFLPEASYRFEDAAPGEPADNTFPHLFADPIRTARTTQTIEDFWARTPALDNYIGALASSLVADLGLGQRPAATDVLTVGFSALDLVGHTYGPRSHEVQDVLARLDQTIGQLLSLLDRAVGRDRYVLALSADHGVAPLPEQAAAGTDAGRITSLLPTGRAIDGALRAALGPGRYVEAISSTSFYFRPGVLDRIKATPAAANAVQSVLLGTKGVQAMYWSWDLASATPTTDPVLAMMRKSYMARRSGDLVIVLKPLWVLGTEANHGSPHDYDTHVPVAFYGAGVKAGRYGGPATPIDIAPTLARLAGIRLARTDGQVLSDALTRPQP
ncbi:MAG: alkaline phosphatase family protein [Acidobacteria bacterium]|nr:alkaline phosphatase family protein [Acidobacteriota bacterium]